MSAPANRRRWLAGFGAGLLCAGARAAAGPALEPFASYRPGPVGSAPGRWHLQVLRGVEPNASEWVELDGRVVLRMHSQRSASAVAHPVPAGLAQSSRLNWRWRVDGFPRASRLGDKPADDFAARVYLIFDYPLDRVPFGDRMAIRIARAVQGDTVPAAALVYVWHQSAALDTLVRSPYSDRARMIVARSSDRTGHWFDESRDIRADFGRAFGAEYGPGMPPIAAIALGADTDQSGGQLDTWFDAVSLDPR